MPGKLWENTREWHHRCEEHPVGSAMAAGTPSAEWYGAWLAALLIIHYKIDLHMPDCARRTNRLISDINHLTLAPRIVPSVVNFLATDLKENEIQGFAYVLTGAHLMGGEIMRRRLENYPTEHLVWDNRKTSLEYLQSLRDCEQYTDGALMCFQLLYNVMEEILTHG
jgi:hypothetical protein